MPIKLNTDILTEDWLIQESTEPTAQDRYGAAFALANGYLGYRADGYLRPSPCVLGGLTLGGEEKAIWAPDGLWMQIRLGETSIPLTGIRQLNLHEALLQLSGSHVLEGGALHWEQERFVSAYDLHLIGQQTRIQSTLPLDLLLEVGIHLPVGEKALDQITVGEEPYLKLTGNYAGGKVATVLGIEWEGAELLEEMGMIESQRVYRSYRFRLSPDCPLIIEQMCSYYHSQDMARLAERPRYQGTLDPLVAANQDVADVLDSGYLYARQVHEQQWHNRWEAVDIQVAGEEKFQMGLRYGLFQQMMHSPVHADLPIGLYGLNEADNTTDLRPFLTFDESAFPIWRSFALPVPLSDQLSHFSEKSDLKEMLYICWDEPGWSLVPFGLIWPMLSQILGLRIEANQLFLSPQPAAKLSHLACRLYPAGQAIELQLTPETLELSASILNLQPVEVAVGAASFTLQAGQSRKLSRSLH